MNADMHNTTSKHRCHRTGAAGGVSELKLGQTKKQKKGAHTPKKRLGTPKNTLRLREKVSPSQLGYQESPNNSLLTSANSAYGPKAQATCAKPGVNPATARGPYGLPGGKGKKAKTRLTSWKT